jgi:hypothetical protein
VITALNARVMPLGVLSWVLSWVGAGVGLVLVVHWWRRNHAAEIGAAFWHDQIQSFARVFVAILLPLAADLLVRFGLEPPGPSLPNTLVVIIRFLLAVWAGWRVVRIGGASALGASLAGPIFLLVDHVLVKGIYLLLSAQPPDVRLQALLGVLLTFALFIPLSLCLAWVGGLLACWWGRQRVAA